MQTKLGDEGTHERQIYLTYIYMCQQHAKVSTYSHSPSPDLHHNLINSRTATLDFLKAMNFVCDIQKKKYFTVDEGSNGWILLAK